MNLERRVLSIRRAILRDQRGAFLKVMRGDEAHLPQKFGEAYLVWADAGQSRGGHFHPSTGEWFTLLEGECRLVLVDPNDGERIEMHLAAIDATTILVPAGIAHRFDSVGQRGWMLFAYASNAYDPKDTIMFDCGPTS